MSLLTSYNLTTSQKQVLRRYTVKNVLCISLQKVFIAVSTGGWWQPIVVEEGMLLANEVWAWRSRDMFKLVLRGNI